MGKSVAFVSNTVDHLLLFLLNEPISSRLSIVLHGTRIKLYYMVNIIN